MCIGDRGGPPSPPGGLVGNTVGRVRQPRKHGGEPLARVVTPPPRGTLLSFSLDEHSHTPLSKCSMCSEGHDDRLPHTSIDVFDVFGQVTPAWIPVNTRITPCEALYRQIRLSGPSWSRRPDGLPYPPPVHSEHFDRGVWGSSDPIDGRSPTIAFRSAHPNVARPVVSTRPVVLWLPSGPHSTRRPTDARP